MGKVSRVAYTFEALVSDLAAGMENARLEIIPNAAHSPQLENPQAGLRAVTGQLERARGAQE